MKCRKCRTDNLVSARFCRHCGMSLTVGNIMDLYPKLNLIPTNLVDWKTPKVGKFIKGVLSILICVLICLSLYSLLSTICYSQFGHNLSESYETRTEDLLGIFHNGYGTCYRFNGGYYSSYDYHYDIIIRAGEYIPDPEEWTADVSLRDYRKILGFSFLSFAGGSLMLFLIMHFIICGYSKRPKDAQPLHEVADYCQKYSYWGIFRRKKTPKFVFYVKYNKFGILDVAHYSVFLPARYDFLEWREKKKYLNAIIDGRNCIIDIYGKELK